MNTFQNQYKEPLEKAVLMHSCLSMYLFSECVHSLRALMFFMLCGIISFANANGFYSVYALRYSLYSVCVSQRFLFCLSLYMFSEWHLVPQLCIQIKQSRVYSRKALAECKASRRLGKQIRGLSRFLSKPTLQHIPQRPTFLNDVRFSQDVPLAYVTTHSTTLPYNHPH